ncbi:ABC transporter substrate-binding protein [Bradyrhizobium sediminis]|uniref:ABC transporter substrate-binding protein n=1 Tax=Bradyrhizobium sediminis TaxID=2840469 RepID=A0A975NR68_9BRAD|nr:ABC transporter substrate-binding protein [Bradyrhizobium sediminis]QWG19211.1 ABC transporter substrate-binding protein [Bradyrhizobium sediminis]
MKRREFIGLIGGTAAWPVVARAQPAGRMRRIAILMDLPENDASRQRVAAFVQGLVDQGWREGRDVQMDIRWGANSPENIRKAVAELLALEPDIILTSASGATAAMRQASATIPIVFVLVTDPVGAGFVDSLARPGGNLTGFTLFEYSIAGKWLELLKEIAPTIRRVAVLRDVGVAAGSGQFGAIQAAASSLGVELQPLGLRDADEIDRGILAFAPGPNDGLLVTASPLASVHREKIISVAARHRLPSVFAYRHFVAAGGLVAYGPDLLSPMPRAASYVSRILKGEKAADLPVQAPTKYDLVINLRTAKALGLSVTSTLLARADEVIE